jgi:tetratricopeptide (TPR) repeat protein
MVKLVIATAGLFLVIGAGSIIGQSKEYDKLKGLVDKGNLVKAREYCDKVTAAMDSKTSGRFYALMGLAYYNKKDFPNSAEMLLKSEDKKLSARVAKEFENEKNDFYDLKMAGRLYRIAQENEKAAEMLFKEKEYEEAALICPSPDANYKFGRQLFDNGKYPEALHFFKRAKRKGMKFSDEEVLDFYYKQKAYDIAYSIQNFGEGHFSPEIQGTVIAKMLEKGEIMPDIIRFLDNIGVKGNKQNEAVLHGMIATGLTEKAEEYCKMQSGSEQQASLAYLAEITVDKFPGTSAWANIKSGKVILGKQLITTFLTEKAFAFNDEWENEPVSKSLMENFFRETRPTVDKSEQNYCDFVSFAWTMANTKNSELAKQNPSAAAGYAKAAVFLKQLELQYCKKK